MRFDLTVPLARFVAKHSTYGGALQALRDRLGLPRRAPAKGRFREFVQCDFDTVAASGRGRCRDGAGHRRGADGRGGPEFTIALNDRKISTDCSSR